jgi:hypothetical protein
MTYLVKTFFTFTPTEWEIFVDRLEGAPGAIAEALDCELDLIGSIETHDVTSNRVTIFCPVDARRVLVDALEGSTYLARCADAVENGELTSGRLKRLRAAARSAVAKLRDAGIPCNNVPIL